MNNVPLEGEVHIGISDYVRPSQLATLLARIAEQYPGLRMRTQIDKSDVIADAHRSGALDLAIILRTAGSPSSSSEDAQVLRTEPLLWVAARNKPAPLKDKVIELALLPETCSLHRLARSVLDAHGIPHAVAHMASGVAGLQAAVAAGLGVACLNASAVIEADMVEVIGLNLPALPTIEIVLLPSVRSRGAAGERLKAVGQIVAATLAP